MVEKIKIPHSMRNSGRISQMINCQKSVKQCSTETSINSKLNKE